MRRILLIFLLIHTAIANAQTWQWAKGAGNNVNLLGSRFGTTDKSGNLYLSGVQLADSVTIGSFTIHNHYSYCTVGYPSQVTIAKYDTSGHVLWAKGGRTAGSAPLAITTDKSGHVYLLGYYDGCDSFGFDNYTVNWHHYAPGLGNLFFLAKFDAEGTVDWITNGAYVGALAASNWLEYIKTSGLGVDDAGNVYIGAEAIRKTAYFGYDSIYNATGIGAYIAKYDSAGNFRWAKSINDTGVAGIKMMNVMPNGDLYLGGTYSNSKLKMGNYVLPDPGLNTNIFLAKLDSSANVLWTTAARAFASPVAGGVRSDIMGLGIDDNRNIYVTGTFGDSIQFGTTTLVNTFPGFTYSYPPPLNSYFVKLDNSGNVIFAKILGVQTNSNFDGERAYGLCMNSCNDIWLVGAMDTTIVIDGNVLNAPPNSSTPIYIARYNLAGTLLEYFALPSGGYTEINISGSKGPGNPGKIYISGNNGLYNPLILGPDTVNSFALFVGLYDPAVSCGNTIVKPLSVNSDLKLYPNPASDQFTIAYSAKSVQNSKAQLYNITGQLVYTTTLKENETMIYTSTLPPGIYICKISIDGQQLITKKVLVGR